MEDRAAKGLIWNLFLYRVFFLFYKLYIIELE